MRRFERHEEPVADRPGINPFTKTPIVIRGRPARTVRCELVIDGTHVQASWSWWERGACTAGPHVERYAFDDREGAAVYSDELAEDLVADGFREAGREQGPTRSASAAPQFDGGRELLAAIVDHCRRRRWFGCDALRSATARASESRRFRYAPASEVQIAETERRLGFALPPLLRALYSEVANGGFGPGYGLLGAAGGAPADDVGANIADMYRLDREASFGLEESGVEQDDPEWFEPFYDEWPGRVLRLTHWGCAIWSCLDVRRDRILRYEHVHGVRARRSMVVEATSLRSWLERWLHGDDIFRTV